MSTFEPDVAGVISFLNEQWALDTIDAVDQAIADEAHQLAPLGTDPRRGHIRDTYTIERAQPTGHGAEGAAGSTDPFGHIIEYGSVNNPPYRPVTRAVHSLGLVFEEDPR